MKNVFLNQINYYSALAVGLLVCLAWWFYPSPAQNPVKLLKSPYGYQKTVKNIKKAITSNNFRVVRQNSKPNSHTLYFCNFNVAHKAILKDKRAGVFLPCKIKVIKSRNQVYVATLNMDTFIKQTGVNIGSLCGKIKASIDAIIEEATI